MQELKVKLGVFLTRDLKYYTLELSRAAHIKKNGSRAEFQVVHGSTLYIVEMNYYIIKLNPC